MDSGKLGSPDRAGRFRPDRRRLALEVEGLSEPKQAILDKLLFRIRSAQKARNNKYILLNAPNDRIAEIIAVLPGMKAPTVLPLAEEGWSSVHSVVQEDEFWDIIEQLREKGAQGILVVPIEKMIV